MNKKITSLYLIITMILLIFVPTSAYASEKDYSGHWAEQTIQVWLESGYINGYPDGSFNPEGLVTRAEFVKMVNKSFGYTELAVISFNDVISNDWYYQDIQKAYKAGYIFGISKTEFAPNNNITREQAAVIISKILGLGLNPSGADEFSDSLNISHWAKNYVGTAANEQLIKGYEEDNSFKPQNPIKRAEAIELLNRALTKSQPIDLTINSADTVIENKTINNLHITKDVGNGNVTLKNVIITGELLIEGGGENSIIIENSNINHLTTNKTDGKVRISLEGDTTVELTSVNSNVILEQEQLIDKGFEKITIAVNSTVELKSNKRVTLTSNDKTVAAISSNGTVTAKKPGVSVITAVIAGKKKEICEINVVDPTAKTIKILSIGNSFSQDAVYYLHDIAKSAGVNIIVGNLYSSGCSLERHWNYAINNDKAYIYYKWVTQDMITAENQTMKDIILDEEWDYITFQQSSGESGIYDTYQPYLNNLITFVNGMVANPNVKLALNMTWAYSSRSTNENFTFYNHNQKTMYNAVINAYEQAAKETGIDILIPCGTAIQNARTNKYLKAIGNELTSDGYHLNLGMGRYIAGLTMFETISNEEKLNKDLFKDVTFIPNINNNTKDLANLAKKAVKSSIANPLSIETIK